MQRHWQFKFPACSEDLHLQLHLNPSHPRIACEGFKLNVLGTPGANQSTIELCARDARGLLGGFGHLLHATSQPGEHLQFASMPVCRAPGKPIRGIYFATHFFNYYQTAPLAEIKRYLEELALWGMNTLFMWYDMHHFAGFSDPRAEQLRQRLDLLLTTARQLGLDTGLMLIGNEAYANSPVHLRADGSASRGGFYDCGICPSSSAGLDYLQRTFSEFFDWLQPYHPTWLCFWPYDQGSCNCVHCRPWGSRGFLNCVRHLRQLAGRKLPSCKTMLSTWFLDPTEWSQLKPQLTESDLRPDALLMQHFTRLDITSTLANAAEMGLPVVGFPEISMRAMFPWGGFGANPQPRHFHSHWQRHQTHFTGGLPYSEGRYEDVNKTLWLQQYVNPQGTLDNMLAHYLADLLNLPPEHTLVNSALQVLHILEANHHYRYWPGMLQGVKLTMDWFPSRDAPRQADEGAEQALLTMQQIDVHLPAYVRCRWRWRLLMIRTLLDAELKTHITPTHACLDAFAELDRLYHVTADTDPVVRSPHHTNG